MDIIVFPARAGVILYNTEPGEIEGSFVCRSIPVYSNPGTVNLALAEAYDYYVYDYGSVTAEGFDGTGAADKDITICVLSDSPLELLSAADAFAFKDTLKEPFYIFNLVHERDRDNVLKNMQGKEEWSFFSGYSPSPFILNGENKHVFSAILKAAERVREPGKKRRWFKR
jgi:hypothetical protein